MQRNEIHLQIAEVAEKIATLNKHLSASSRIMKAETDLLNVYVEELKMLLNELTKTTTPTAAPQPEPKKEPIIEKPAEPVVVKKEIITEPIAEPVAAKKVEIKEEKKAPEAAAPQTEPAKETSAKTKEPSLNERFSKKTIDIAEKLQQAATDKHLKDLISISDKFMFVNELFKNDSKHFEEAIKKLNELNSFDEAVQFIEEELKTNFNWDKKQQVAEQFQQMLKKKFGMNN
jgi:outer membrane biosynthesis protein TonB